jgi:hypothetical protein
VGARKGVVVDWVVRRSSAYVVGVVMGVLLLAGFARAASVRPIWVHRLSGNVHTYYWLFVAAVVCITGSEKEAA